jgi:hypothetical protein
LDGFFHHFEWFSERMLCTQQIWIHFGLYGDASASWIAHPPAGMSCALDAPISR